MRGSDRSKDIPLTTISEVNILFIHEAKKRGTTLDERSQFNGKFGCIILISSNHSRRINNK